MGEDREKILGPEGEDREKVLSPDDDVEGHKLLTGDRERALPDPEDEDVEAHKLIPPGKTTP